MVIVGLLLLAFVLVRTFSTNICGGFLICGGSPLPPFGNTFALLEWTQHFSIVLIVLFGMAALVMALMVYNRQDWDMISALRVSALFFAAQSLAAVASMILNYQVEVFHLLAGALTLVALTFLIVRVLYTDNDEYRQGTYIAVLGLISLLSIIPYFWIFMG